MEQLERDAMVCQEGSRLELEGRVRFGFSTAWFLVTNSVKRHTIWELYCIWVVCVSGKTSTCCSQLGDMSTWCAQSKSHPALQFQLGGPLTLSWFLGKCVRFTRMVRNSVK